MRKRGRSREGQTNHRHCPGRRLRHGCCRAAAGVEHGQLDEVVRVVLDQAVAEAVQEAVGRDAGVEVSALPVVMIMPVLTKPAAAPPLKTIAASFVSASVPLLANAALFCSCSASAFQFTRPDWLMKVSPLKNSLPPALICSGRRLRRRHAWHEGAGREDEVDSERRRRHRRQRGSAQQVAAHGVLPFIAISWNVVSNAREAQSHRREGEDLFLSRSAIS